MQRISCSVIASSLLNIDVLFFKIDIGKRKSIHSTNRYRDRYRCIDPLVYRITLGGTDHFTFTVLMHLSSFNPLYTVHMSED